MSFYILKDNGEVVSRATVQAITTLEQQTSEVQEKIKEFDEKIKTALNPYNHTVQGGKNDPQDWMQDLEKYPDYLEEFYHVIGRDPEDTREGTRKPPDEMDKATPGTVGDPYLKTEIALPRLGYDNPQYVRVTKQKRDENDEPTGTANTNPLLDTWEYI